MMKKKIKIKTRQENLKIKTRRNSTTEKLAENFWRSFILIVNEIGCITWNNEEESNWEGNFRAWTSPESWQPLVSWRHISNCHSEFCTCERRRNKVIRIVKTLNQLTEALNYEGCDQQHSSLHLHLLPRNSETLERKRHVDTVYKYQNSKHSPHVFTRFSMIQQ